MTHDGWKIDPDRTMVVVNSVDGRLDFRLRMYLDTRFPVDAVFMPGPDMAKEHLVVARNRIMQEMVLRAGERFQHFVLMDDDIQPDWRTDEMFKEAGDLVGAEYPLQSETAWLRPTDVHLSCLRFTKEVAQAIKPPYFRFTYNEEMTTCLGCECNHFRQLVLAQGFRVSRAGLAGHSNLHRWCCR
jgi:hypothetical protein